MDVHANVDELVSRYKKLSEGVWAVTSLSKSSMRKVVGKELRQHKMGLPSLDIEDEKPRLQLQVELK